MMTKSEAEISDEELKALTHAIKTRYGLDFTNYESQSLKRGFHRLIRKNGMGSLLELWSTVLRDRSFFLSCIDDLTVNLTELFRNPEIWIQLRNELLEDFINKEQIHIWHAGCSTGEEVYSMAYLLHYKSMLSKSSLLATDLSKRALEKAQKGEYAGILKGKYEKGFLNFFPSGNINALFDHHNGHLQVKEKFKKNIRYLHHNLVSSSMNQKFDIIFCRNVMIYFDEILKLKVIKLFYESLKKDGYLILGYYDLLPEQSKQYFKVLDSVTRVYTKV